MEQNYSPLKINKSCYKISHWLKCVLYTLNKVNGSFRDNIWGIALTNMHLTSKYNKLIHFFNVLLIFSVNMHGLFHLTIKKVSRLLLSFKRF